MFILYVTKTKNFKRYVIKKEGESKPCNCIYEEHSRHATLYDAIETKIQLESEAK